MTSIRVISIAGRQCRHVMRRSKAASSIIIGRRTRIAATVVQNVPSAVNAANASAAIATDAMAIVVRWKPNAAPRSRAPRIAIASDAVSRRANATANVVARVRVTVAGAVVRRKRSKRRWWTSHRIAATRNRLRIAAAASVNVVAVVRAIVAVASRVVAAAVVRRVRRPVESAVVAAGRRRGGMCLVWVALLIVWVV